MKEYYYEKLLHIKTAGKDFPQENEYYHPYEPTPYGALEELFKEYPVQSSDSFVDFGCGKGRLNFFLHYNYDVSVVGIERSERHYQDALQNLSTYKKASKANLDKVTFYHGLAEAYPIKSNENCFYFFNPFSIQIFMKVIHNILRSYDHLPREIHIILYYPSLDYIFFLENKTVLEKKQEIVVPRLYEKDNSERFLIYSLPNTLARL